MKCLQRKKCYMMKWLKGMHTEICNATVVPKGQSTCVMLTITDLCLQKVLTNTSFFKKKLTRSLYIKSFSSIIIYQTQNLPTVTIRMQLYVVLHGADLSCPCATVAWDLFPLYICKHEHCFYGTWKIFIPNSCTQCFANPVVQVFLCVCI